MLNMLVGVVVENFQKCRDTIEKDRQAEKEKKERKETLVRCGVLTFYCMQLGIFIIVLLNRKYFI